MTIIYLHGRNLLIEPCSADFAVSRYARYNFWFLNYLWIYPFGRNCGNPQSTFVSEVGKKSSYVGGNAQVPVYMFIITIPTVLYDCPNHSEFETEIKIPLGCGVGIASRPVPLATWSLPSCVYLVCCRPARNSLGFSRRPWFSNYSVLPYSNASSTGDQETVGPQRITQSEHFLRFQYIYVNFGKV